MKQNKNILIVIFISNVFMASLSEVGAVEIFDHGVDLKTKGPLIIAHRGASGTLPEHTLEAYQLALDEGADVIECDVCVTKDRHLVCLHESWLNHTTNVAEIPKFNNRLRTYRIPYDDYEQIQFRNITDWFSVDFTLAELKELRKKQNVEFRNPNFDGLYLVASLTEMIQLIKRSGRNIGLHLETKASMWVNSLHFMSGTTIEELLVETLGRYGYTKKTDPCFLQSFSESSLLRLGNITELPLVRLVGNQLVDTSESVMKEWAKIFYGIGPWKDVIVPCWNAQTKYKTNLGTATNLIQRAHSLGLKVHAYTFRNEDKFLAWDFHQDPMKEYEYFINLGVDGLFTDFPGTMKRYVDTIYKDRRLCSSNVAPVRTEVPSIGLAFPIMIYAILTSS